MAVSIPSDLPGQLETLANLFWDNHPASYTLTQATAQLDNP